MEIFLKSPSITSLPPTIYTSDFLLAEEDQEESHDDFQDEDYDMVMTIGRSLSTNDIVTVFDIPKEVWIHILSFLNEKDLFHVSLVDSFLYNISQDNFLWKPLYIKKWNVIPIPHKQRIIIESQKHKRGFLNDYINNNLLNQSFYIHRIYNSKLNVIGKFLYQDNNNSNQDNNNNNSMGTNTNIGVATNIGPIWKSLYRERRMIVNEGGIEEFFQLLSTLISYPLEFNRKAMMTMYTLVFQLCIVNYKMKNCVFPPSELYGMLVEIVHNHLMKLLHEAQSIPDGKELILFYTIHWQNYLHSIKRINIVFRYFHRDWISKQGEDVSRPINLHVKGSSWWKKLVTLSDPNLPVAHLTTMMSRGWVAILFSGLQKSENDEDLFSAFNKDSNVTKTKDDMDISPRLSSVTADQQSIEKQMNRLTKSIQLCQRNSDSTLISNFLLSVFQLQEYLILSGDESANVNVLTAPMMANRDLSPTINNHHRHNNNRNINLNQNYINNHSVDNDIQIILENNPFLQQNILNSVTIMPRPQRLVTQHQPILHSNNMVLNNILNYTNRCPFCNIFNNNPPVLCDEKMNRVAKKCYTFLISTLHQEKSNSKVNGTASHTIDTNMSLVR
ncbi:hypothetical protein CYY_010080 [Polysphondylium violaceum]|uniref:F-box domain-containing protein n=1 Tax=Polysphondylium violaceum TaxID=133409 RepID=A0A8J4V015_9MYCE|nr:hypothetical protein CYY_010080 [Polysphondylium violaceum]